MPERDALTGLLGYLRVKSKKFLSGVTFKKCMNFILRFQRQICSGEKVVIGIDALRMPGHSRLQKKELACDLAVSAPVDIQTFCKIKPGFLYNIGKTAFVERTGLFINMQINIVPAVVQTGKKLF